MEGCISLAYYNSAKLLNLQKHLIIK